MCAHDRVAQPRLAGVDGDRALGEGDDEAAARKRAIHSVSHSDRVDGQALVDRTDHAVEGGRIEPRRAGVLEREAAAAGKRTDKGNRTHSASLGAHVEREPAGE